MLATVKTIRLNLTKSNQLKKYSQFVEQKFQLSCSFRWSHFVVQLKSDLDVQQPTAVKLLKPEKNNFMQEVLLKGKAQYH
jgi:hypothetical protein